MKGHPIFIFIGVVIAVAVALALFPIQICRDWGFIDRNSGVTNFRRFLTRP